MKHLKLFKTETEYTSYKNGIDYVLPNVSYVEETKIVGYKSKPDVELGTFTVSGRHVGTYQYEIGMTWENG